MLRRIEPGGLGGPLLVLALNAWNLAAAPAKGALQVGSLEPILREQLTRWLPVKVSPDIQHLVNLRPGKMLVTLINNRGVTKAPRAKPVSDHSQE